MAYWLSRESASGPNSDARSGANWHFNCGLLRAGKKKRYSCVFRPQYESLLANYDFYMLIPGHGRPIYKGAKEAAKASIDQQLLY
jgi:hypothetical protein